MNPWIVIVGGCTTIVLLPFVHGVVNRVVGRTCGFVACVVIACGITASVVTLATSILAGDTPGAAWQMAAWQAALCAGLCACYAVTVLGLRETSPSVRILQLVRDAGPDGRALPDIVHALSDRSTIAERIVGADALGIVRSVGDRIVLTPVGLFAARRLRLVKRLFRV